MCALAKSLLWQSFQIWKIWKICWVKTPMGSVFFPREKKSCPRKFSKFCPRSFQTARDFHLWYRGVLIARRVISVINKFWVFLIKNVEYSILHYYGEFYVITANKWFYPIIPDFMIFLLTKTKVVPLLFSSKCMFFLQNDVHKMDLKNHTFWETT